MFFFNLDDPMLKHLSNKTSDVGDRLNNRNNAPVKSRYSGPDSYMGWCCES